MSCNHSDCADCDARIEAARRSGFELALTGQPLNPEDPKLSVYVMDVPKLTRRSQHVLNSRGVHKVGEIAKMDWDALRMERPEQYLYVLEECRRVFGDLFRLPEAD